MTAINCFRLRKSVIVMTDAAYYDTAGVIGAITDKSVAYPGARTVIAGRGKKGFYDDIVAADLGAGGATFDSLLRSLPGALREIMADCEVEGRQEVLIAGWSSERNQGESYLMFTEAHKVGNGTGGTVPVPAYSLLPLPAFVAAPSPPPALLATYGLLSPPAGREISAKIEGVKLMEAQRRTLGDYPYVTVGGFVRAHTITAKGVISQIIHRWPDVVGQPIANDNSVAEAVA